MFYSRTISSTATIQVAPVELLQLKGWDAAADRPRYAVPALGTETAALPARDRVLRDESRWRIQVGARIRL